MPPGKLRKDTLSELRKARNDMTSIEWLTKVEQLSEAEQTAAARAKLNVSLAIRKLENAQLAEIRQQLVVEKVPTRHHQPQHGRERTQQH